MSEFLGPFLTTFLNVGFVALLARFAAKHLALLPAKPIALAVAFGLYIGRSQVAGEVSNLDSAGSGAGGLMALGLLWFFWFERASHENANG
nr:hypothetical protein [uncultured Sphingosinicella sp.]